MRGKSIIESRSQPAADFKLKQFSDVKSRLFELPRLSPNARNLSPKAPKASEAADERIGGQKPGTPEEHIGALAQRAGALAQNAGEKEEEEMDMAAFERECERLKQLHGKKEKAAPAQIKKDSAGRPAYLQRIKSDLADKKQQVEDQRNAPYIPPGYRQMPEEERLATLEGIKKKREELEKAFQNLPFNIETVSQRKREQTLKDKIAESDKAIATFSNPRVLIEA
jgi:hypothetical protein